MQDGVNTSLNLSAILYFGSFSLLKIEFLNLQVAKRR